MSKRERMIGLLVLAIVGLIVTLAITWWSRPLVVEAGDAVVLVEGRELRLGPESHVGVGVTGTLGLVGDRCVGLVRPGQEGTVVVWPAGTTVSGAGADLAITSEGETVRLGEEINAGTEQRSRFPAFEGRLPEDCEDAALIDVTLER